jgi:hypothetical protein
MQLAGNVALANALAVGQKRYFTIKFMVDWARDGTYADVNSDLSSLVVSADIDRQLTGNYPAELEVTEGYAAAQMVVKLEGDAPDGTPVWRLFSPYSIFHQGTTAAMNTPCYLGLIVETTAGPVEIRQFTGVVRNGVPSRRTGGVHLIIRDAAALLQAPISLDCWAVDYYTREVVLGWQGIGHEDSGTIVASSVMDHVLRRSGFYEGPAWHPNVVLAWSLCGSALPEVGTFGFEDPQINGAWSFGYGQYTIPQFSPAGKPAEVFEDGQYGKAFRGTGMPDYSGRSIIYLYGNAHSPQRINPLSYGTNNCNMIGISAWIKIDPAQTGTSVVQFHLEEARYDYSGINRYPAYIQIQVVHSTGLTQLAFVEEGWVDMWVTRGTVTGSGWHQITAVWAIKPTALEQYLFDGFATVTLTPFGTQGTWPPTSMTYAWPASSTNHGQVIARGPMQFVQVFYMHNTPNVGYVHPAAAPVDPKVKLDLSTLRLLWRPKIRNRPAWDILRAISSADMGALYVTEHGVITFDNRETIKARQDIDNVAFELDLDQLEELDPQTVLESVINNITWGIHAKHAESELAVFKSTKPSQFETAASTTRTQPITIGDDVQSMRLSFVTYRPAAMGYQLDGSPTTYWQNYMQYYKPDFWADGFTPYGPGTRTDPSLQPVPRTGANVQALLGFSDYIDQDPAHLRLTMSTGSAGTIWYAVDDSTAFLHVSGTKIIDDGTDNDDLSNAASIAIYGIRTHSLAGGEWLQDSLTVPDLAASLLADTQQPRPFFESLEVVGDPRVQLQDVGRVNDPEGMGGPIFASVVGIKRKISQQDGVKDQYTMRTFGAIGGAWIMDDPDFSIMDQTTIVS